MSNVLAYGSKFSEVVKKTFGWQTGGRGGMGGGGVRHDQIQEGGEQWWIQTLEVIGGAGS